VLVGHLGERVDPVAAAAPVDVGVHAAGVDRPLAARARIRREEVRRVRQLHDVQAAWHQVRPHRGQVPDQVIEGEQVTGRVQHGHGGVEPDLGAVGACDPEVAHVRLDDFEGHPGRLRLARRVGAHRRRPVERRGPHTALGEFPGVLGRARGEFEHRPDAGTAGEVRGEPGLKGGDFGRDVAVGAGQLVQLGLVVDTTHLSNDAVRAELRSRSDHFNVKSRDSAQ
jgi:hypothetical protein